MEIVINFNEIDLADWVGDYDSELPTLKEIFKEEILNKFVQKLNYDIQVRKYIETHILQAELNQYAEEHHNLMAKIEKKDKDIEKWQQVNFDLCTAGGKLLHERKTIRAEAYKECIEKVKEEITEALKSNYKAIQGRIAYYENEGDMFVGDEFVDYCNGKIDCLRGLDYFLDNLLKELVGEDDE